jgi:hypothetical protein
VEPFVGVQMVTDGDAVFSVHCAGASAESRSEAAKTKMLFASLESSGRRLQRFKWGTRVLSVITGFLSSNMDACSAPEMARVVSGCSAKLQFH